VASALVPNRPSGTSDTPAAVQRRRSRIHKHDTTSRIAPAQRQGHGSTWSAWDLPERPPRRSVHRPSSSPTRTRRRGLASSFRSTFDSLRSVLAGRRGNPAAYQPSVDHPARCVLRHQGECGIAARTAQRRPSGGVLTSSSCYLLTQESAITLTSMPTSAKCVRPARHGYGLADATALLLGTR
jgi:hypothetical protein